MKDFKIPLYVANPAIKEDLKNLNPILTDEMIDTLLAGEEKIIFSGIVDRIEFIHKLGDLHEILVKRRTFYNPHLGTITIEGKDCLEMTRYEKIDFEGRDFNGFNYDIEALQLYLQTTIIEHIAGQIINDNKTPYDFLQWFIKNSNQEIYTKAEIATLYEKHKNITGTRRSFRSIFYELSNDLKKRILENLVIAKIGLACVDKNSYEEWGNFSEQDKLKKIAEYLYDQIRCSYTHNMRRTFSSLRKITSSKPIDKKILIIKGNEDLFNILNSVIAEIFIKLCNQKLSISK